MSKFAIFDADGFPAAFYSPAVHGERLVPIHGDPGEDGNADIVGYQPNPACTIPADAIEISDEIWMEFLTYQGLRRWENGQIVVHVPPPPTLEEIRAAMPVLSPRQLWLAAARISITKDQVLAMVDAMEDQEAALDLQIEINEAPQYERDHPAMDDLRDLMGIPPEQFDDLWIWASGL